MQNKGRYFEDFKNTDRSLLGLNGTSRVNGNLFFCNKLSRSNADDNTTLKSDTGYFIKSWNGETHNFPAREVALLEFFRLMCPWQPKVRFIRSRSKSNINGYVCSKEIPNNKPKADSSLVKHSKEIEFFGIHVLKDRDYAQNNNIMYDNENITYSVDGGYAGKFSDSNTFNVHQRLHEEHKIALLKFMVCPDSLFSAWETQYHVDNTNYSNTTNIHSDASALKKIRNDLIYILTNKEFRKYLFSNNANNLYNEQRKHVENFCIQGKVKLITDNAILVDMDRRFMQLKMYSIILESMNIIIYHIHFSAVFILNLLQTVFNNFNKRHEENITSGLDQNLGLFKYPEHPLFQEPTV